MNHKDVDKFGKFVVDAMMLALLWAIIALPISSFSLVRLDKNNSDVLSAQHERLIEDIRRDYENGDKTKSYRSGPVEDGTEATLETVDVIEVVSQ